MAFVIQKFIWPELNKYFVPLVKSNESHYRNRCQKQKKHCNLKQNIIILENNFIMYLEDKIKTIIRFDGRVKEE